MDEGILAGWRRLFSTVSNLSKSVCTSGCIKTEEWKKTEKDIKIEMEISENQREQHMCNMA